MARKPASTPLWWPNLVGAQELYDLKLTCIYKNVVSGSANVRFGIREATTYVNEEGWREYTVNGKKGGIRIMVRIQ